jgi:hypothetical protein
MKIQDTLTYIRKVIVIFFQKGNRYNEGGGEEDDNDNSFSGFHDCQCDGNINHERITGNNVVFTSSADTSNI